MTTSCESNIVWQRRVTATSCDNVVWQQRCVITSCESNVVTATSCESNVVWQQRCDSNLVWQQRLVTATSGDSNVVTGMVLLCTGLDPLKCFFFYWKILQHIYVYLLGINLSGWSNIIDCKYLRALLTVSKYFRMWEKNLTQHVDHDKLCSFLACTWHQIHIFGVTFAEDV